jgi:hypothetical protein
MLVGVQSTPPLRGAWIEIILLNNMCLVYKSVWVGVNPHHHSVVRGLNGFCLKHHLEM